jgi:Ca-activated chloride channel family protein
METLGADDKPFFVPLKKTRLTGSVTGPTAELLLTQEFSFTRAQLDKVIEAVYKFPLPGNAAINGVKVCFGENEIVAELKEVQQAKAEYQQAKEEGRQAVLVTQETPGVFNLRVAGVHPDQPVTVETSYYQLARSEGLKWVLSVPLTPPPRFVNHVSMAMGGGGYADNLQRAANSQPSGSLADPGHTFSAKLTMNGVGKAWSSTHVINIDGDEVTLDEVVPNRDFVLEWLPFQDEQKPFLQAFTCPSDDGHTYFMAMISPPAQQAVMPVRKETIILVDRSGSMDGSKWSAATLAVKRLLLTQSPEDYFALGLFHNDTYWLTEKPAAADGDHIDAALEFLNRTDSGGTNLRGGLEKALAFDSLEGEASRHIIIITDCQVCDNHQVLNAIENNPHKRKISVLSIDSCPNDFLSRELAERTGGEARFFTSIQGSGDITLYLDEIVNTWSQPLVADTRINLNREAEVIEKISDNSDGGCTISVGDLQYGKSICVFGRTAGEPDDLKIRMSFDSSNFKDGVCSAKRLDDCKAVRAFFGAYKIRTLEGARFNHGALQDSKLTKLGYGSIAQLPMQMSQKDAAIRAAIVKESLDFGVISTETAFVAISKKITKVVDETVDVPNASPDGWLGHRKHLTIVGVSGYSGAQGCSGFSGFSGCSGISGFSGVSGFSGTSCYSGSTGQSGLSGYSGESGSSGASGTSGFSCASPAFYSPLHTPQNWTLGGQSGYSGTSGFSGCFSGLSGFSGTSGYSGHSSTGYVNPMTTPFKVQKDAKGVARMMKNIALCSNSQIMPSSRGKMFLNKGTELFSGTPSIRSGEAELFNGHWKPENGWGGVLLEVEFKNTSLSVEAAEILSRLVIQVYADDEPMPRANTTMAILYMAKDASGCCMRPVTIPKLGSKVRIILKDLCARTNDDLLWLDINVRMFVA